MVRNEKYRFALAVHSQEVVNRVLECTQFVNETIHPQVISFDEGESEARSLLAQGYEVILCHGGTGETILRALGHSVVLIQKTDADVMKALCKARKLANEVALTVHTNEFRDLDFMQDILGMNIHAIKYSSKEELLAGVNEVYDKGVRVVIGGGPSRIAIEKMGGKGLIIEPNPHSILQALDLARSMARAKRENTQYCNQLIAILKHLDEGVIFIDVDKNIIFSNSKANQHLKISRKSTNEDNLSKYFESLNLNAVLSDFKPRLESIVTINKEKFVVNTLPVSIHGQLQGVLALFRDITSIRNITSLIHERLRQRGLVSNYTLDDIKGTSPPTKRLIKKIERYAPTTASILICGETGSGKELVAHAIHDLSPRRKEPFIAVNCCALPETLLESELFGYEEGAFTGAKRGGKVGLFELANQGTIFLDEIGEISHGTQLRLLRVLEAKEIMRLGGDRIMPVDVRVVSASHRQLADLVHQGSFRLDLFFRLAVLRLNVPPLRERLEDIPFLVGNLFKRYGKDICALSPTMLEVVHGYEWPGNIRELFSFFESYLILLGDAEADEELFQEVLADRAMVLEQCCPDEIPGGPDGTMKDQLLYWRRKITQSTIRKCHMNKQIAAKQLGISYNTLWRILSKKDDKTHV